MPMTNKTVLLVEDNERLARMMSYLFQSKRMNVEIADNGSVALELLERTKPDIIILDINMPIMNGLDFCEEIKTRPKFRKIPILVVSGEQNLNIKERLIEMGVYEYIMKPFRSDNLVEKIENVLTAPVCKSLTI